MSLWHQPLHALRSKLRRLARQLAQPTLPPIRTYSLDDELIESIQELAKRDGRSQEEMVSDLLTFALEHRRAAEENLRRWRTLTPREQQVVALVCKNYTNRQIAAHLVITPETVKSHIRNAVNKFDLSSKTELRLALSDWDFSAWHGPESEEDDLEDPDF